MPHSTDLPTTYTGNLTITPDNLAQYQALTEVRGSVSIEAENASLPALTEAGYVEISAENASLPALTSVTGSVYIRAQNASLPALTKAGYVSISAENASLPALTKAGYVSISAENASLPALTKVRGYVEIRAENASLPALTKAGYVSISAENASLPALTKAGYVEIRAENASLPALTSVSGHSFEQPSKEIVHARLVEVAKHALAEPAALDMTDWHSCDTTHCIAGWAVHLAGQEGYDLERKIGASNAGLVLLGVEAASMFFLSNKAATERLRKVLADNEADAQAGEV